MESNSPNVVLSLFLLLQLGGVLAFVLSTLYILYCFNRAASSAERMADAAEAWLALQHYQAAQNAQTAAPSTPTNAATTPRPEPQSVVVETVRPTPPPPPQTTSPLPPQTPPPAPQNS